MDEDRIAGTAGNIGGKLEEGVGMVSFPRTARNPRAARITSSP
jgi:hypothetical protein